MRGRQPQHSASRYETSPFLRLPVELRQQIYDEVIHGKLVQRIHSTHYIYFDPKRPFRVLPILLVSRAIYEDIRSFVFSTREFTIIISEFDRQTSRPARSARNLQRGLDALGSFVQSVQHLHLLIHVSWYSDNAGSVAVLDHLRAALKSRSRPLSTLKLEFDGYPVNESFGCSQITKPPPPLNLVRAVAALPCQRLLDKFGEQRDPLVAIRPNFLAEMDGQPEGDGISESCPGKDIIFARIVDRYYTWPMSLAVDRKRTSENVCTKTRRRIRRHFWKAKMRIFLL